jgi:peroxiredoxin
MDAALLIARLVLGAVFTLAGLAKLSDLQASRQAIIDFGVPSAIAAPLGLMLPLAELTVAATLLPASTAWWGALGALALLSVFVVGITYNLARGRKPECHCFGQLHSAPAGWKTLARNGVLATIAGFVLWAGYEGGAGPSALSWVGALSTAQQLALLVGVLVLFLLAGQWWFLVHLLRQNGRLLVRLEAVEASLAAGGSVAPSENGSPLRQAEGLPVGSEAPNFSLSGLYGETFTLEALRAPGKPVMMLFTDPGCGPCNAMLPEVGRWQEEYAQKLTLTLISRGEVQENKTKASEHGLRKVLLQKDWEVSESYEVTGTPSAVLISPDAKIASPVAGGAEGIRGLLSYAVGERAQLPMQPPQQPQGQAQGQPCPNCGKVHAAAPTKEAALPLGEDAPGVKLPDLEGNTVELTRDFEGQQTLLVFWNPGCGFCQQMLPDLRVWEDNRPEEAPKLLVVSAGTEEANREQGLSSTVLLDQNFATGRAFGASGTPSAVLVDAQGKVASDIAVGAPAVLELAGASRTGS